MVGILILYWLQFPTPKLRGLLRNTPERERASKCAKERKGADVNLNSSCSFLQRLQGFLSPLSPPLFTSFTMGILKTAKRLMGHTVL